MKLKNKTLLKESAFIDGQWVKTNSTFAVTNPYNGKVIAEVTDCNEVHATMAIKAAKDAFSDWSQLLASERSQILRNWFELILENLEDLAQILTLEQGKPLNEAKGEIKYGASFIEWFAEEAKRIYGDVIPSHGKDKRITVIKQAVGVVAAITPWNFPNAMITRKVAPALAAGCTVVIKPSDLTPLSALAIAQLALEAGFPPGVLNIIPCKNPAPVGNEFCTNPIIKKISFTGSTAVGKLLLKQSADQVIKVSLELGGNAPFIVFEDADIDKAVEGCIASKFRNAGQTCVCSNRIFVQNEIYNEFNEKLANRIALLKSGDGLEKGIDIGPMINEKAIEKNERLLKDAEEKGATILTGGKRFGHQFFEPTLVCDVNAKMDIFKEEIFGPVAPIYKFESVEEVVNLANDTPYGLAAYFYGRDYAKIWKVAEALEYGMVGINTGMISTAVAPFGGIKESGFGREGSKYGIEDYVNIKYMCWGGIE